eukprot:GHRR01000469.1.p1 GENE.GHRR01000469.1~~GHRR01000469.1.p1  ORF type:complete len:440 (+),score=132.27 GHRR01000469.1:253-1572(+)
MPSSRFTPLLLLCVVVLGSAALNAAATASGHSHTAHRLHRRALLAAKPSKTNSTAKTAAGTKQLPGTVRQPEPLGFDDSPDTLLPEADEDNRVDGNGKFGSKMQQLLGDINDLAGRVPRLGSNTIAQTAARGADQAQVRNAFAEVETLPLRSTGNGDAGSAAIDNRTAVTVMDTKSVSVAKDIVNDDGNDAKNLGAASQAQGVSVTRGRGANQGGSSTIGTSTSEAGEKGYLFADVPRDGAIATTTTTQRGIGEKVSTRLQAASLSAVSPGNDPEKRRKDATADDSNKPGTSKTTSRTTSDDSGPANSAGSILFASLDTEDTPGLSTTRDFGKDFNTQADLSTDAVANRYGYTYAPAVTGTIQADSTLRGQALLSGGQFGTGFHFSGPHTVRSSTYLEPNDDTDSCGDDPKKRTTGKDCGNSKSKGKSSSKTQMGRRLL